MRQIRSFQTDDPKRLDAQLSQLEENVIKEFQVTDLSKDERPNVLPTVTQGGGFYTTGQAILCDVPPSGFTVNVEPPLSGLPGFITVVVKQNTLTVIPTKGAINLGTSVTLGGTLHLIFFDGIDWWTQ